MVPVNRDVQSLWCGSILHTPYSILGFWRFVMPYFSSMILLLVLVLVSVSKRIWITVYHKIRIVIKYYLVLIENR